MEERPVPGYFPPPLLCDRSDPVSPSLSSFPSRQGHERIGIISLAACACLWTSLSDQARVSCFSSGAKGFHPHGTPLPPTASPRSLLTLFSSLPTLPPKEGPCRASISGNCPMEPTVGDLRLLSALFFFFFWKRIFRLFV